MSYAIRPQCFHDGGTHIPLLRTSRDDYLLHLKGRIFDSVKATTKSLNEVPLPTTEDVKLKVGLVTVTMWKRNFFRKCEVILQMEIGKMLEVKRRPFGETILCGMVRMRGPAPEQVLDGVEAYMDYAF